MNLYLIESIKWRAGWPTYETNAAFVIRAESMKRAREVAAAAVIDEPAEAWLNPEYSACRKVGNATTGPGTKLEEGILVQEDNAS